MVFSTMKEELKLEDLPPIVANKWKLLKKIGLEDDQSVFSGVCMSNNQLRVAVKVESKGSCELLRREARVMNALLDSVKGQKHFFGFPRLLWYGQCEKKYKMLVMELLGGDLDTLFTRKSKSPPLSTLMSLAVQMLDRIEYMHRLSWCHGSIKPDNFLLDKDSNSYLYLIDFELSHRLYHRTSHVPFKRVSASRVYGNKHFLSINAQAGIKAVRRDDIESLVYSLVYLLSGGYLPWMNMTKGFSNSGP
eukprot:GHVL01024137.1.p1 GENE.GHVL01024137.1~~GHVL01024137.1.p1  ORF type:complete len:248 (-),score=17.73 GHVL01024137.1:874-1617(-)